jgi:uncharacterized protein (DUF2252 family)
MKKSAIPIRHAQRLSILSERQRLKMARSAHAYVRGSTAKFYEWLETSKAKLAEGPPVWICGDCHVGNLGPTGSVDGRVEIQVRDMDQTVIGNPAHDIIRLGLSLAMAARGSNLPGVTTALMMESVIAGYEKALVERSAHRENVPPLLELVLRESVTRSWAKLLRERLEDTQPTIPLGTRFWPLTTKERAGSRSSSRPETSRSSSQDFANARTTRLLK